MRASVSGASDNLGEWLSDWVIEYAIFLHGLAQQWRPRKKQNLAQSQPPVSGWCSNFYIVKHSLRKFSETANMQHCSADFTESAFIIWIGWTLAMALCHDDSTIGYYYYYVIITYYVPSVVPSVHQCCDTLGLQSWRASTAFAHWSAYSLM